MKRMAKVPGFQLVLIASLLTTVSALGQIAPYYGYTNLAGLAGSSGSTDGTNTGARFYAPYGLGVDAGHNVYVAEYGNHTLRKITPGGVVTTLAGLAGSSGSADGTNGAARFNGPMSATVDSAGNVFVSDTFNGVIRKVTPAGVVTTLAGTLGSTGSSDGALGVGKFYYPLSLIHI